MGRLTSLKGMLLSVAFLQANADLTQQLADHGRLLRALREQASDMAAQIGAAQDTLASKDRLIEQLKLDLARLSGDSPGISGSTTPSYSLAHRTSSSGSPGTASSPSMLRGLSRQSSKSAVAAHNGVGKVRRVVQPAIRSSKSTCMQHSRGAPAAEAAVPAAFRAAGCVDAGSAPAIVCCRCSSAGRLQQCHCSLSPGMHVTSCRVYVQVVSAWKESSKLKDHKIEELNFQLGQAVTQLELARSDAAALQQQLLDSKGELSSSAAALAAVQARAAAQLQALESQLASKESGLAAAEVRRQALEAELNSANSKVSGAGYCRVRQSSVDASSCSRQHASWLAV